MGRYSGPVDAKFGLQEYRNKLLFLTKEHLRLLAYILSFSP